MYNILVLTSSAWDDTNSGGNTFSNLFSNWSDGEFSNVYCREAAPSNKICKHYYRITAKMLLKNLFTAGKIGKSFVVTEQEEQHDAEKKQTQREKRLISLIHKFNFRLAYVAEDILWSLKGWQNKRFDCFLEERRPQIIFSIAIPTVQRLLLLEYMKRKTGAKVMLLIADHVCYEYFAGAGNKGKAAAKRMRRMLGLADKVYAITDELAEAYSEEFGAEITVLRKGCSFDTPVAASAGRPFRMMYAGNLLYGRMEILQKLGETVAKINDGGERIVLDIYSGTEIGEADESRLTIPGASYFHGARPFDEIQKIMGSCDAVLHVESFEKHQMEYVKYSFSTKITDALESGKNFVVIGPAGISSVEYPRRIPGVTIIDDLEKMEEILRALLSDDSLLIENAHRIRAYAMEQHSMERVHALLHTEIAALCE